MDFFSVLKAIAALAFVLGLLLGGAWALRKYGSRIGLKAGVVSTDLKVTEWRSLDMRRKLAVVRWGEREHLICLAPTGDTLIASRDAPPAFKAMPPDAANDGPGQ
ncbi:MAG: flagellar biosynthetic protein FliO [Hyphomonadaceae bacterium]